MALTIVFMGTPEFSVPTLQAIHAAGHRLAAVYTQPPRPAGRGMEEKPSAVHRAALGLSLPVRCPTSLKAPDEQAAFAGLGADVAVVVAYGLLLPQPILDAPRYGALNGHASLLPRWRGAAPIQRAIEAGDRETGMMVMRMELGLDTGPVALSQSLPIGDTETAAELHDRLAAVSASLMVDALERLEAGTLTFEDQEAIAAATGRMPVYARKIDKAEARLNFALPARDIARKINAFSPFPGAWAQLDGGAERFKLLRAAVAEGDGAPGTLLDDALRVACGDGAVQILELQKQGGKPMKADDFLRGQKLPAGTRFS
ncbi:methionyl-tRNA formyltransferase [Aureimonas altamirensis]|uniref:methionyl-tRNA formyltransferase n=1 Tax=Aureimonas altamirensis TaxID=370622 RepID=UPI0030194DE8